VYPMSANDCPLTEQKIFGWPGPSHAHPQASPVAGCLSFPLLGSRVAGGLISYGPNSIERPGAQPATLIASF
jgi:hypothetical protein